MKHKLLLVLACLLSLAILLSACGLFSGSDLERKEIISFTQQALDIETKRSDLMRYFTEHGQYAHWPFKQYLMERSFLQGVSPNHPAGFEVPPPGLEGMISLRSRLLLLYCPQSMQHIKDTLAYIFNSEISQARLQFQENRGKWILADMDFIVYPQITKDNIDELERRGAYSWLVGSPWWELQRLRQQLYSDWVETLQEHGIDPAEEGFTEL